MRTRHHIFSPLHPGKSILCSCCMVLIVCLFTACDSKQSTSTKPTLTVTLEPLRYFTETIAGDKFKIVSMVPKGSSPETYDPTPNNWSIWIKAPPTCASAISVSNKPGWINWPRMPLIWKYSIPQRNRRHTRNRTQPRWPSSRRGYRASYMELRTQCLSNRP